MKTQIDNPECRAFSPPVGPLDTCSGQITHHLSNSKNTKSQRRSSSRDRQVLCPKCSRLPSSLLTLEAVKSHTTAGVRVITPRLSFTCYLWLVFLLAIVINGSTFCRRWRREAAYPLSSLHSLYSSCIPSFASSSPHHIPSPVSRSDCRASPWITDC